MATKDPKLVAQKWARNLSSATEDIRAGVESLTVSPTKKAIEKKDKMVANWQRAIQEGKWEAGLQKVSLEEWKDKMLRLGVPRISQGAQENISKFEDFMNQLLPYIENVKAKIEKMPDTTLDDRINRAIAFMREMAKFRKR